MQCQAVVALVGPAVFHGRIYKTVHGIDFRLEFIVSGSYIMQVIMLCTNNYADSAVMSVSIFLIITARN